MSRWRTLPQALADAAGSGAGYTFAVGRTDVRRSYAELQSAAFRVAGALRRAGLSRGDLVAIAVADAERFLTVLCGASIAGLIPAPLAPPGLGGDLSRYVEVTAGLLRAAGARAVIVPPALAAGFEASRAACPDLALILSPDVLDAPPLAADVAPSLDDLAFVQFTSGSTSAPKGVALTHRNVSANIEAINGPAGLGTTAGDSAVSWLPLHHDMGLVGMALGPMYASRPAVLLTPAAFVKRPAEWLHAISRHRATVSFAPNFAYDLVVRRVNDRDLEGIDLSTWRVAGCGAEPIHAPTLAAFADRLAGTGFRAESFLPCYGLAEHVLAATLPPRNRRPRVEHDASGPLVGCGRALPDHALRIVRADGREAAEREVGEITLRGPSVMKGYYRDVRSTRQILRGGWLHTGDLGYIADGELFVSGRARDLIIVNGQKYHPHDLERAVDGVDGVRRGRVVAFGEAVAGASDRLVVVVEEVGAAGAPTSEVIRRRIGDLFGLYVDEVISAPGGTIGRTTSGKVRRAAVREWYTARRPAG